MSTGKLVIAGVDNVEPLREEVRDLDVELMEVRSFYKVRGSLEATPPLCILADCETSVGQEFCLGARISSKLEDTPIISMVADPWSSEVRDAYALGVDDFMPKGTLEHLGRKLMALRDQGGAPASDEATRVVMADPDRERRVNLARSLRKLGMGMHFCLECPDVTLDDDVRLVVAHCSLPPDGGAACLKTHRDRVQRAIPWILVGTGDELLAARKVLEHQPLLRLFDVGADPAQIITVANELLKATLVSQRSSVRLPYATSLVFDIPNSWSQVWGYTFNLSLGGVFVRTLTPPPLSSEVEMEFCPPFLEERVKLSGMVVWRQEYLGSKGYPSGFGVQFADNASEQAREQLEQGYQKLLEAEGNPRG